MTQKRKKQIKEELEKRLAIWLEKTNFEKLSFFGSKLIFEMSLGAVGLGHVPKENTNLIDKNDFQRFITDEEFNSPEYNEIINELFEKAYETSK